MFKRIRHAATMVAAVLLLPFTLAGCSGKAADCEKAFPAAALSVDGVVSASWDCSFQFGGGWQRGDVVLEASTKAEAMRVMENVLKAYAASPDLKDEWHTPEKYTVQNSSIEVWANSLDAFNGAPQIRDIRAHYGITPG
ncbi:hypothetical protein FB561_3181 [Kribbella amoyensis]|uniref:Peptidase inhibitor family I36 n=1 Tax=Kribbella amoyensis TaxID=996641 RepID=A0A561BT43_9ACTN|nr:hypothetical protein [Kribbella amoyensis]TWD82055.1 hypothetical protein FB561_3181 [Kribbella amoyensis]